MAEIGLIVTAEDRATAVLKKIGSTGQKALGPAGLGGTVKALPEQFGKAGSAMIAMGNASTQMGGKVGQAVGQVSQLGALVATGGPVGIALAASAALTWAASTAWEAYTADAKAAKEEQARLNEVLKAARQQLAGIEGDIRSVSDELTYMGMTAAEVAIQKQQELIAQRELDVRKMREQLDAIYGTQHGFRKLNELEQEHADNLRADVEEQEKLIRKDRERLALMEELEGARKIEKRSEDAKRKSKEAELKNAADLKRFQEEEKKAAEEKARREEAAFQRRIKLITLETEIRNKKVAIEEENARRLMEQQARVDQVAAASIRNQDELFASMATTAGEAFASMISDSENAGKHMTEMVLSLAEKTIMAHAAEAGAGAGSAVAAIPVIGPALMPAAIAAAFGLVRAMLKSIPGFAFGGTVTGGTPNRDSVPALLTPGERVLTQRQAREYEKGMGGGQGRTINVTIAPQIGFIGVPSGTERRRVAIELGRDIEREVKSGNLGLVLRNA